MIEPASLVAVILEAAAVIGCAWVMARDVS
jgi:hypothetical protein